MIEATRAGRLSEVNSFSILISNERSICALGKY